LNALEAQNDSKSETPEKKRKGNVEGAIRVRRRNWEHVFQAWKRGNEFIGL